MTDLERRALLGEKLFLLSSCELKAAAPSENTSAGWWIRPPSLQRPAMEGRGWHKAAAERGAKLRPDMQRGKVYLYQLYTTCFVEFDTMEQARAFRQYANESLECWDYDPVATIDTNDPESLRPHGRWIRIKHNSGQVGYECSCCGSKWPVYVQFFAYCPYCGAKMED